MNRILCTLGLVALMVATACNKTDEPADGSLPDGKVAPDGFNYNTSRTVSINIRLLTNGNEPLAGKKVSLHTKDGSATVFTGISNAQGYVTGQVGLPTYTDTLLIDPATVGLARNLKGFISGGSLTAVIGGSTGFSGNIAPISTAGTGGRAALGGRSNATTKFVYMGTYNSAGYPNYLVNPGDAISSAFLNRVDASFPEKVDMRTGNPGYLSSSANANINITAAADVWVTFVSEGAGYYNSLGYFTYPTNQVPTKASDIDTIFNVFPNASMSGSGGDFKSGDKVKLGTFPAGTSIGFALLSNAWNGLTKTVRTTGEIFYSIPALNPEATTAAKKHAVLLYDQPTGQFVTGFEDINRDDAGCDQDFNDLIFYTKSNPITAISTVGVPTTVAPNDRDADGITDDKDEYPDDYKRAYNYYYPGVSNYGTIGFEDLWPSTGDYDMNDLLISFRYKFVMDAANQVVDVEGKYAVGAAGASFNNGFGVQLPVAASTVSSVTGRSITGSYLSFNSNGTEAGQTNAVIIPFDSHRNLVRDPNGGVFINTQMDRQKFVSDTVTVMVKFATAQSSTPFLTYGLNHFLISNQRRGYEIHLPGYAPTDKADKSLFGMWTDNSSVAANRYYLAKDNSPWAIQFLTGFQHPIEQADISNAYLKFDAWVQSGGTQFTDWYTNTATGYRNSALIYTK